MITASASEKLRHGTGMSSELLRVAREYKGTAAMAVKSSTPVTVRCF